MGIAVSLLPFPETVVPSVVSLSWAYFLTHIEPFGSNWVLEVVGTWTQWLFLRLPLIVLLNDGESTSLPIPNAPFPPSCFFTSNCERILYLAGSVWSIF